MRIIYEEKIPLRREIARHLLENGTNFFYQRSINYTWLKRKTIRSVTVYYCNITVIIISRLFVFCARTTFYLWSRVARLCCSAILVTSCALFRWSIRFDGIYTCWHRWTHRAWRLPYTCSQRARQFPKKEILIKIKRKLIRYYVIVGILYIYS